MSAGTVPFDNVDVSPLNCAGSGLASYRGCDTPASPILDALVSGATPDEKTANAFALANADGLHSNVAAVLARTCHAASQP